MKIKWLIGLLVVVLSAGIFNYDSGLKANQVIMLEFNSLTSSHDSENFIKLVERELSTIGVEKFKVLKQGYAVRISYYSTTDISNLKRTLGNKFKIELESQSQKKSTSQFPFENDNSGYKFDVQEINSGIKTNAGLNGLVIDELIQKLDRLYKPKTGSTLFKFQIKRVQLLHSVVKKLFTQDLFVIEPNIFSSQEVRAGPNS